MIPSFSVDSTTLLAQHRLSCPRPHSEDVKKMTHFKSFQYYAKL